MGVTIEKTELDGVLLITPDKFGDERGFFSETYNAAALRTHGIEAEFDQDNHSFSATPGTLRGLHFQRAPTAQTKLVRVTRGSVLDVAVDIRTGSPTYGRHVAAELSADNWTQILVPAGFAHGFCTLEPDTEVLYKVDAPYAPQDEGGLRWDDPDLGIQWPEFAGAVLSQRDGEWPSFTGFASPFSV
tara:strand:+ start:619 stop:1179 length:561 start_codon:yes stop_codon:yes gene_type:complete